MTIKRMMAMKTFKTKQAGVALAEFALILPWLLILTFITTEIGRALFQYNILAKSVRDAARYLSTYNPGDTTKFATAKNLVVYGNPSGSGSPLVIGLTTSLVPNPVWQTAGTAPVINTVTIKVTGYAFTPVVASVFGLDFAAVTYSDISATMRAPL